MQGPPPQSFSAARDTTRRTAANFRNPGAGDEPRVPATAPDAEAEPPAGEGGPRTPLYVLIVDEDPAVRHACAEIATQLRFHSILAASATAALTVLEAQPVDLLLLDLKLRGGGGLALLQEVRRLYPGVAIVVMTAYATVSSAVEAMRSGASDYLTKPVGLEQLTEVRERMSRHRAFDRDARALRERIRADAAAGMGSLVGRSPAMEKLYRMLGKVAFTTHPVLILGESGTGKEVVARLIHSHGANANKPFIPVDCGSLVPTLIEGELFGHVKGAFAGAVRPKEGLLVAAGTGTVFLDDIGELPVDLQAKLLRALQEKEVRPVGGNYAVPIGARILAATDQDLPAMVESGRFRKDLYFRLNVVNIHLPALRERKDDIPLLAVHLLERVCYERESTAACRMRLCVCSSTTTGPAMFASWNTLSNTPSRSPAGRCCTARTSLPRCRSTARLEDALQSRKQRALLPAPAPYRPRARSRGCGRSSRSRSSKNRPS